MPGRARPCRRNRIRRIDSRAVEAGERRPHRLGALGRRHPRRALRRRPAHPRPRRSRPRPLHPLEGPRGRSPSTPRSSCAAGSAAERLDTYCGDGSLLGVHPEHALRGVDFSTGSLGQGLLDRRRRRAAARLQGSARRVFVLVSDAECNEGSLWEAVMFAAHHRLANLVAIVDLNGQQALGYTERRAVARRRWRSAGARSAGTCTRSTATTSPAWRRTIAGLDTARRAAARAGRAHGLRQGRLVHGAPDQVALLADVGRRVPAGARRDRGAGCGMRRRSSRTLVELAEADDAHPAADRRPRLHGARAVRGALSRPLLQRRRRRAEHGRASPPVSPRPAFIPFVYSIVTFASLRPYEFIRNGPVLHQLPGAHRRRRRRLRVRPAGHDAPRARGPRRDARAARHDRHRAGRPRSRRDARCARRGTCPGPVYYRIGKDDTTTVPGLDGRFALGRAQVDPRRRDVVPRRDGQRRGRGGRGGRRARGARRRSRRAWSSPACSPRRSTTSRPRSRASRSRSRSRRTTRPAASARSSPRSSPSAASAAASVRCGVDDAARPVGGSQRYMHHAARAQPRGARGDGTRRPRAATPPRAMHDEPPGLDRPARPQPGRPHRQRSSSEYRPRCSSASAAVRDRARAERLPRRLARRVPRARQRDTPSVRVVESERGGWGRAVRLGLAAARGDLLCYTNSARTAPQDLALLLLYATAYPGRRREGEPQDPRALAPAHRLAALQHRVPGALRPVQLGRQRHAEGLPAPLRPAARPHRATTT